MARAVSSLSSLTSTTTTCPAPAMRAACTAARPMPPAPMTHTVLPGSTAAVRNTAPMPVVTPQPIERGPVQRHVLGDDHHAVLVDEDLLGEAAQPGELVDGGAVASAQAGPGAGGARRGLRGPRSGRGGPTGTGGTGRRTSTRSR